MGVTRVRVLISAPLPQVWEFLIEPANMHLWGPPTRPVTGFDRPFQAGDRVTWERRDYFWTHRQMLLVEKVVPYHALHFRDLSPGAARLNVTATLRVAAAKSREATWVEEAIGYSFGSGRREATWVEEAIGYSFGSGRVVQWLDRWVINPLFQVAVSHRGREVFRRLQALLAQPHGAGNLGSGQEEQKRKGACSGSGPS